MKKIMISLLVLLYTTHAQAQMLQNPESVTYDSTAGGYFVSNVKTGAIHHISTTGDTVVFVSGFESFLGLKLYEDSVLYAVENRRDKADAIIGFHKNTGEVVFALVVPGTKQLNDIEFDDWGNLYVSDRQGNKIYKADRFTHWFAVVDSTITTPNGLFFDKINNRMLVCNTTEKSNIYAIDLKTNQSRLLLQTDYSHLDGITMDSSRNIYFTSWSSDWKKSQLLRYDGTQISILVENESGMADIEFNEKTNQIAIALYYGNRLLLFNIKNDSRPKN